MGSSFWDKLHWLKKTAKPNSIPFSTVAPTEADMGTTKHFYAVRPCSLACGPDNTTSKGRDFFSFHAAAECRVFFWAHRQPSHRASDWGRHKDLARAVASLLVK